MNFGAFAGGLAQGGMSTYLNLSQNQRAQDEQDARNQARAREQADRELAQRTLGRADTTINVPNPETPETEAVGLGFTPQTYTRAQAYEDYAKGVSDPKQMVQYAGLADQHKKQTAIEAIAKASQYWDTNPLQAIKGISQVYAGVPDGYSTDGMTIDGKPMLVIKNDKTGAVQMHDMSDPYARQLATLRAYSAIDPERYGPMYQQAMVQFQQLNHQGAQIAETGRHNKAGEGLTQQQINNTAWKQQQDVRQGDEQIDLGYEREAGLNYRSDQNIGLYREGLRGATGSRAGGDPYKGEKEKRAAEAAWIKNNPGLYSITPEGSDKPVTHPGMLTLASNLYKYTDEATAQQVAMAVQAQAQQAALDPATGRLDFAKYRAALDRGSSEALLALQRQRGGGQAPNGVPNVEANNPTNIPNLREKSAATMDKPATGMPGAAPAAAPKATGMPEKKSWKDTVAEKEAGYAKAAKIEDDPRWKELQAKKQAAAKAGNLEEARKYLKQQNELKASFGK
jgi:hypothetical protein